MTDSPDEKPPQDDKTPATEDLQEPSTEKAAGGEPKAPGANDPEPSHQAVGIGVIGGPLVAPEDPHEDTV